MKPAILSPLEAGLVFRSSRLEDFQSRVQVFQDNAELQLLLAKIADESFRLEEISKSQEVAYTCLRLILPLNNALLKLGGSPFDHVRINKSRCRRRPNFPGGQMESMIEFKLKGKVPTLFFRPWYRSLVCMEEQKNRPTMSFMVQIQ
jgi:hypothetical protein